MLYLTTVAVIVLVWIAAKALDVPSLIRKPAEFTLAIVIVLPVALLTLGGLINPPVQVKEY